MKIQGAIFDMDGTLLDSMGIWRNLMTEYVRFLGLQPKEDGQPVPSSMTWYEMAFYLEREYGVKQSANQVLNGIDEMLEQFYFEKAPLKPGVAKLLEYLHENGVKMCILTMTERYLAEAALKRCGVLHYFEKVFNCQEEGSSKDDSRIFEKALSFLGTQKARTIVFEDSLYAMETAKAAGFPVVAVHDAYHEDQASIRMVANCYVDTFEDLTPAMLNAVVTS